MSQRNTVIRALHDVGLGAWFGGSLMGAIGLNGAANEVSDPRERAQISSAGWARWTPVNAAAIGAHLVGAVGLLQANSDRVRNQKGVATNSAVKTALTAAALGVTAYSRLAGKKVESAGAVPASGGTIPSAGTPSDVTAAMQRLRTLQWIIPALTGALIAVSAQSGELQRPDQVASGFARRAAERAGLVS